MNINGRMKVRTLKSQFKEEFGLTLRVYDGRSFADEDSTLAAIRKGDSKGGEFAPRKNTKVGNLEDKIQEMFGIKVQIAGFDDSYLCDNDLTLQGAFEKDQTKKKPNSISSAVKEQESDDFDAMNLSSDFSDRMRFDNNPDVEEFYDEIIDSGCLFLDKGEQKEVGNGIIIKCTDSVGEVQGTTFTGDKKIIFEFQADVFCVVAKRISYDCNIVNDPDPYLEDGPYEAFYLDREGNQDPSENSYYSEFLYDMRYEID